MLDEILDYNRRFVEEHHYKPYETSKYPDRKIAILTCMDTRLTHLLPAAMGLKNGEVKLIKNAGGIVFSPYDTTVRSLLIAILDRPYRLRRMRDASGQYPPSPRGPGHRPRNAGSPGPGRRHRPGRLVHRVPR